MHITQRAQAKPNQKNPIEGAFPIHLQLSQKY
jgi:hypothetical protein